MSLRKYVLLTLTAFALLGTALVPSDAVASGKKKREIISVQGKITALKNGKDRTKKRYWEYKLRTASGKTVIVHDYQYGRYRQPATMGIQEGAKRKVRGFYVRISTKRGSSKKEPVLIVSPGN